MDTATGDSGTAFAPDIETTVHRDSFNQSTDPSTWTGSRGQRWRATMPMTARARDFDSLRKFRTGAAAGIAGAERPIPLASTSIDVTIRGGLAFVAIERTFRNSEAEPIEATMTFPVP